MIEPKRTYGPYKGNMKAPIKNIEKKDSEILPVIVEGDTEEPVA